METTVSIREFGRMVGVSDMAVRKAIKSGSIKKGVTKLSNGDPAIYPNTASVEWGKPFLTDTEAPEPDSEDIANYADGIPDNTPNAEADRMIAVYKAKKARLEYLETESMLIDKGLVYSRLYDFAGVIRDAIMNVPDRCIDNILAADGRNQALIIMGNELAEALTALSKTEEFEIIQKR